MLFYDCDMIYYETSNHAMFVHIAHFSFLVKVRGSQFCKHPAQICQESSSLKPSDRVPQ